MKENYWNPAKSCEHQNNDYIWQLGMPQATQGTQTWGTRPFFTPYSPEIEFSPRSPPQCPPCPRHHSHFPEVPRKKLAGELASLLTTLGNVYHLALTKVYRIFPLQMTKRYRIWSWQFVTIWNFVGVGKNHFDGQLLIDWGFQLFYWISILM